MHGSPDSRITELLAQVEDGQPHAAATLLPLVYDELRRIAGAVFRNASPADTLQPTVLVHEAWMKLAGGMNAMENRRHFFAVAAKAMRQVLADHAKAQRREKRGGNNHRVTLDEHATPDLGAIDLVALDDSLRHLAELNPRHAQIVELRLLGALTVDEVADHLGISPRTVASDWVMARTWLRREFSSGD